MRDPASSKVVVGLSLFVLPVASPESSLLGINATVADLLEQDRSAVDRPLGQAINERWRSALVKSG